jgi:predicted membrane-bound mannosyltransferase
MRIKRSVIKLDILIGIALILAGLLTRLPYLAFIPLFDDETTDAVYSLTIKPGEFMPLVNIDPYNGPMFSYILAASLRLLPSPVTPRIVVMIMGALTVGVTYWLARAAGLGRPWAILVGLLMATNPLHIVVNSHLASSSYIVPLFSTAFLAALVLAVKRESGPWLIAAGALLGGKG